jgi:hypothetical protein
MYGLFVLSRGLLLPLRCRPPEKLLLPDIGFSQTAVTMIDRHNAVFAYVG